MNDGPIIDTQADAPEIAAFVFKSSNIHPSRRTVRTYLVSNLDTKPRFFSHWSPAYEPLQYSLLLLHVESGWSGGDYREDPFFKSRTVCQYGAKHVPFLTHRRQHLLCESTFHVNSRLVQEWMLDMISRHEEHMVSFLESYNNVQKRIASYRSIK